jgi:hypothetical protein
MQQTCKACGAPDKFDFTVSNDVWRAVVPSPYRNGVVCLYCFDEFAVERGVDYATAVTELWFAGCKAVLAFTTKTAINV